MILMSQNLRDFAEAYVYMYVATLEKYTALEERVHCSERALSLQFYIAVRMVMLNWNGWM